MQPKALFFDPAMSIMEGKRDVLAECKAKLETTLKVLTTTICLESQRYYSLYNLTKARYCFMLPAAAINFSIVPPAYRVAFQVVFLFKLFSF